jgi:hypothetical protein
MKEHFTRGRKLDHQPSPRNFPIITAVNFELKFGKEKVEIKKHKYTQQNYTL